jgi:hypothetical protein
LVHAPKQKLSNRSDTSHTAHLMRRVIEIF